MVPNVRVVRMVGNMGRLGKSSSSTVLTIRSLPFRLPVLLLFGEFTSIGVVLELALRPFTSPALALGAGLGLLEELLDLGAGLFALGGAAVLAFAPFWPGLGEAFRLLDLGSGVGAGLALFGFFLPVEGAGGGLSSFAPTRHRARHR